jgi:DNA sulfur modification protein DndB
MPQWQFVQNGKLSASELRKNYVNAHGIALLALGFAGRALISEYPNDWDCRLQGLDQIDWSRSNTALWEGRAMYSGRIFASNNNVALVTIVLKRAMCLRLGQVEEGLEANTEKHRG